MFLRSTLRYENRRPTIRRPTGVRVRVQRSTDGGLTWEDVHSETLPLEVQAPYYDYPLPSDAAGSYRVGVAVTNGVDVGPEVFSNLLAA